MFWQSLSTRFENDPVSIAKQFAILPGAGDSKGLKEQKDKEKAGGASYLSMPSHKRVMYAELQKSKGGATLQYSPVARKGWIPIFWLPWQSGRVVRTTLKDRRDNPADSPKIFITAALNGCTVLVEGDPRNPTVYHANAIGYDPDNIKVNNPALRGQRMDIMKQRMAAVPQPKRGSQGNARVMEGQHYLDDFMGPPSTLRQAQLLAVLKKKLGKRNPIGQGGKASARENQPAFNVDPTYTYEGTVFGAMDKTGNWKFYYQCRIEVCAHTLTTRGADPSLYASWKSESFWLPSKIEQFWPQGGGSAIARTDPPPAWPE